MTFHFQSFVAMVLCVYKDALGGGVLRASTSFHDDRSSSFFEEFTPSEQFVTGLEPFFVIMNFIQRCFSGYHNVRCVHWICDWWNRNFYYISVKNFHKMNFENWSNDCAFGNSCQNLGFWIISINRKFSTQKSNCSPSVVTIWSNFVLFPSCHKILEVSFSHTCVSCVLLANSSKLKTFSRILFPVACVGRDTKNCTSSGFNLVII